MQGGAAAAGKKTLVRNLAGVLFGAVLCVQGSASAEGTTSPAGKNTTSSSCVACHTDQKRLQEESAGIPLPAGSALQSGKG